MRDRKKVLVIDDHEEVREFICLCLAPEYWVFQATDGLEGWVAATAILPDLIITDVMMPGMDGNELCRKLKTDARTCQVPVILLSAKVTAEQQAEGVASGADVYLTKPFNIRVLQAHIAAILNDPDKKIPLFR